jgi:hypothetical protein
MKPPISMQPATPGKRAKARQILVPVAVSTMFDTVIRCL